MQYGTPQFRGVPLELVERIVHFSIRVRTFKRALRLRLVNRQFRNLVEDDMFRTRLLDEYVRTIRAELGAPDRHRPRGRDSAWLAFLKRYLAYRIFSKPNLDPQCPESLIHRAAACLGQILDDDSEDAILGYITTLCQVGFWEHRCCFNRYSSSYRDRGPSFVDDSCNYVDSTPNLHACYGGDGPLKRILLDAAIYLGNVKLAKKVYTMDPKDSYWFDLKDNDAWTDASISSDDRVRVAATHGGLDMFRLVNSIELGIETINQYRELFDIDIFMEYILDISTNGGSATLIHFLLDLGMPWDISEVSHWSHLLFPRAMLYAPLPEIFVRLAAIEGPETNALNSRSVKLCCRSDGMISWLNHNAAANNLVMVRYLLDQGGAPYLNNKHTHNIHTAPIYDTEPSSRSKGSWQQWLLNPLVRAVEVGNVEMVALMLAHGADPNHNTISTPLMAAVRRNDLRIARLLIERGADVNLGSPPPVVLAIQSENSAMFGLLRDNGAVIATSNTGGWAMALVEAEGLETMRDLLASQGVEPGTAWHHVQSEEEFVLGLLCFETAIGYGDSW